MAGESSQSSQPLHIENTVLTLGKSDLSINKAFTTYRDMKYDGIISGSMSFIKAVLSKGDWTVKPHSKATQDEIKTVEAINASLSNARGYTKKRILNQWLSMLDYGCSLSEVVAERKGGKFVFGAISPIHLTNVARFEMKDGHLVKLKLTPAENDGLLYNANAEQKEVDGKKVLFIRLESDSDFPLGKSLLYGAYTAWRTKKILQEYEAIGVAKNLSGVLDIRVPSEYINKYYSEPNSTEAVYVDNLLEQAALLHAGKGSYILTASDATDNGVKRFEVTTIGNAQGQSYDVGAAIARYNNEIQLSLQTMVLSLGTDGGGSFALSDNSTYLMTLFIENVRATIASEFQSALAHLWELNAHNKDHLPYLEFEDVEPLDWDNFTKGWNRLIASGGVTPTEDLEAFLRESGDAPQADYTKKLENPAKADPSLRLGDKQK